MFDAGDVVHISDSQANVNLLVVVKHQQCSNVLITYTDIYF